jgi:hypothetical protein
VGEAKKREQLKKKIKEVEKQLADKGSGSSNAKTDPQTKENIPLKMGKTMITPGARDAPKFSSKKPQELRRFVRLMEDLWKEAEITDDEVKKESIGKYADQESEEEWKALETYEKGVSWDEFKEELINNYPEAAAAERGTPVRIRQLCAEMRDIRLGDLASLYAFRRAFISEAKKLARPPAAMSNRELVELFIGSLSETMAAAVLQFLGNKAEGQGKSSVSKMARRPEDRYDLEEVCKAAIQVSESSQGMFHLLHKSLPEPNGERKILMHRQTEPESSNLSQKLEEIENIQAQERDKLEIANKNMDARFNDLQDMMKSLLAQVQSNGASGMRREQVKQYDPNSGIKLGTPGSIPKWGNNNRTNESSTCFYCGRKGHFVPDCEEAKDDVQAGLVRLNAEGKLRMGDGSSIPMVPNTSTIKERVEKSYAKKLNQFYCGNDEEDMQGLSKNIPHYPTFTEDPAQRRARLEYELSLKEREDGLELKQMKLEREEKRKEQSGKYNRAAHVLEMMEQLTEEEVANIRATKSGFL